MVPRQGKPCSPLPDGDALYQIIYENRDRMGFVKEHTPLYCQDERINILWLWCMENYDKYDPERGNLTAWVLGVSRRVIDVYRKERGSRKVATIQYPPVYDKYGNELHFDTLIIDPVDSDGPKSKYGRHENTIDTQDDIKYMWKCINKTIPKVDNRAILQNYAQTISDDALAGSMDVSKSTMQTRRTQYKRKVKNALQKEVQKDW